MIERIKAKLLELYTDPGFGHFLTMATMLVVICAFAWML